MSDDAAHSPGPSSKAVHQREADTQSSKMVLRFREDKIRRLETLSKGFLSVDSYLADEKKMLMVELELIREKVDRNLELNKGVNQGPDFVSLEFSEEMILCHGLMRHA